MKNKILILLTIFAGLFSNWVMAQDSNLKKEIKKLKLEIHTERRVLHHDRKDHHERANRDHRNRMDKRDRKEKLERRRDRKLRRN
jgi:hypothetical protein